MMWSLWSVELSMWSEQKTVLATMSYPRLSPLLGRRRLSRVRGVVFSGCGMQTADGGSAVSASSYCRGPLMHACSARDRGDDRNDARARRLSERRSIETGTAVGCTLIALNTPLLARNAGTTTLPEHVQCAPTSLLFHFVLSVALALGPSTAPRDFTLSTSLASRGPLCTGHHNLPGPARFENTSVSVTLPAGRHRLQRAGSSKGAPRRSALPSSALRL